MARVALSSKFSGPRVTPADPIKLIMRSPVATLDVGATLRDAAEEMVRNDIGALLVTDGARTGLISERDVTVVLGAFADATNIQIDQVATWDLVWAEPEVSVADVGALMLEANVRHIPIGNSRSEAAGIVSVRDLLAVFLTERTAAEALSMPNAADCSAGNLGG